MFADARQRPALDLLARIPLDDPRLIYDLGCGPGNVTALLARRWPEARLIGVDSAPAMLARARDTLPTATWTEADIARWRAEEAADLIFSNAALHWLDDHVALFSRLFAGLAPGGALGVQMPRNFAAASHRLIVETARTGPWADRLSAAVARYDGDGPVAAPDTYFDILGPAAAALDIWETEYLQVLTGENAVLNWIRGTALGPVADALDPDLWQAYLDALTPRLAEAYPMRPDGRTLFPFRRLFIVATRR